MTTEYYTGMGFEKAKALLDAALANEFTFVVPEKARYIPDCQAFLVQHVESGAAIWCLKEIREIHVGLKYAGVLPPIGTLTLEKFAGTKARLFIPWIEKTLGLRVMSELGLPWELDL